MLYFEYLQCPTTRTAVVDREPNSLDTLVELACIFRENVDLFPRTCHLLTILSQDDTIRQVCTTGLLGKVFSCDDIQKCNTIPRSFQDLLNTEKAVSKLTSVYNLTKRKHDRETKRNHTKRLSMSSQSMKKKTNNSLSPLAAATALAEILGLVAK